MAFALGLTHHCNLRCAYCYAGHPSKPDMSEETLQMAVDFAFDITPPGQKIEFGFFGGEPLLCMDLMQHACDYIRAKTLETGHPTRLNITTNGTMLNPAKLDFFKNQDIELCISLDGPQHVHNHHRIYPNGKGSLTDSLQGLRLALEHGNRVQVNAVYGPETIKYLPESLSFLVEHGARSIHFSPNVYGQWDEDIFPEFQAAFMGIADRYSEYFRQGQRLAINIIDSKIILFIKGGYSTEDLCGMGKTQWAFAPSGNIYPCERLIGEDNDPSLMLGNVHTGLSQTRCANIRNNCGNRNPTCQTCTLKAYCMNWCGCTNYFMTGHTNLVGPALCVLERAAMKAARHVLVELSKEENELFFEHFLHYLQRDSSCSQKGDSDKWQLNVFNSKLPLSSTEQ